jgi:protein-disulfide isomerase
MTGESTPPRGSLFRAGRVLMAALFTPSRARWARSRRGIVGRVILIVLLIGGIGAAYAAGRVGALPTGANGFREAGIVDYLVKHPDIVREAAMRLEDKRIAGLVDKNRAMLEAPYAGAWEGAAKPDVTLVAFMDYACGYCRATVPTIARILKEDRGLRVVYRELPVITEASVPAARVSLYAAEKGRFPAFHAAMYAEQGVDNQTILDAARKAGLDMTQAQAELGNKGRNPAFVENVRLARALEAQGTPLLVVGDHVFYGAVDYETLKDAIAKARNRAG